MIREYNACSGVPLGHYYIEEITQFADFELDQLTKITFTSENKQELEDLIKTNCWNNCAGWETHSVKQKT